MIELLAKWFIPHRDSMEGGALLLAYGTLCGAVGIGLNILLFMGNSSPGSCPALSPSRRTPSTTCPMPAHRR